MNIIWVLPLVLALGAVCIFGESVQRISLIEPANCQQLPKAGKGKWLLVHFTAIVDVSSKAGKVGHVYQDSRQVGLPIAVHLIDDEVLSGWILGLDGICEKSQTTFVVPPELGYGDDLTIRFHVEILQVSDRKIDEPSLFDVIDSDDDGQVSMSEFTEHFESRPDELDESGKPPLGLFMKDDINQNAFLNWEEFSGPKGSTPPSVARAVIEKERNDPELSRFKKGDPFEVKLSPRSKNENEPPLQNGADIDEL